MCVLINFDTLIFCQIPLLMFFTSPWSSQLICHEDLLCLYVQVHLQWAIFLEKLEHSGGRGEKQSNWKNTYESKTHIPPPLFYLSYPTQTIIHHNMNKENNNKAGTGSVVV